MKKLVISLMIVGTLGTGVRSGKLRGVIRSSIVSILDGIFSGSGGKK